MLSICIPVYNFNIERLINKLYFQISELSDICEIIVIDDCSKEKYKIINRSVCDKVNYFELQKNIGRSAIRNLFLSYAKYDNLLFLDCDSFVIEDLFVQNYIEFIKKHPNSIVCGGRVYTKECPNDKNVLLRWKYGVKKESLSYSQRIKNPNASFMTNNFVVSRKIFEHIKFDERLVNYGHEDTLFGYQLKKQGIKILHIDNPILNGHLETNIQYINNTENAVINLVNILQFMKYDKLFIQDVTLLRVYFKFRKLKHIISFLFFISKPFIKFLLKKGIVNLYLFDFYKLGMLCKSMKRYKE